MVFVYVVVGHFDGSDEVAGIYCTEQDAADAHMLAVEMDDYPSGVSTYKRRLWGASSIILEDGSILPSQGS